MCVFIPEWLPAFVIACVMMIPVHLALDALFPRRDAKSAEV
jgi:hypothetical protein